MKILLILFGCFFCTASFASNDAINQQLLIGSAYDTKSDELVYQEQHNFLVVDGQKVLSTKFTDAMGQTIAERIVKYQDQQVKSYQLEQRNIDYQESISQSDNVIRFQGQQDGKLDQQDISFDKEVIIDAGFSDFIVQNWDTLYDGETVKFHFASIGLMDTVKLQVRKTDIKKTSAKKRFGNGEVTMFKMTLANPVFRLLIKPIEVGYYTDTKQLAYYKGISNIMNDNGKRFPSVRIEYAKLAIDDSIEVSKLVTISND